jgi:hypothetical protein
MPQSGSVKKNLQQSSAGSVRWRNTCVLRFVVSGQRGRRAAFGLVLTAQEESDLVAFLSSL